MLVLSRKRDEKIVMADGLITISVIDIRGDKVRLGIEAPADIDVHRLEVYKAIKRQEAAQAAQAKHATPSEGSTVR